MSEIEAMKMEAWLSLLSGEGVLKPDGVVDADEQLIHRQAFLGAWCNANNLTERQSNRLFTFTNTVSSFVQGFEQSQGVVLYGASCLLDVIQAIYGTTLGDVLQDSPPQRRVLFECEDRYHAECLMELVNRFLGSTHVTGNLVQTWTSFLEATSLNERDNQSQANRAYVRKSENWLCSLVEPSGPTEDVVRELMRGYPKRHQYGIGKSAVLLTAGTPTDFRDKPHVYRAFVGLHGIVRVPSFRARLDADIPIVSLIRGELAHLDEFAVPHADLQKLSSYLIGWNWADGRQSLAALLSIVCARGLLSAPDSGQLSGAISDFIASDRDALGQGVGTVSSVVAALSLGVALPEALLEAERDAYAHAARVAQLRRPGRPTRMQDIADILGIPRQTASRKWHAFEFEAVELSVDSKNRP